MSQNDIAKRKRGQRGLGKDPAMVHISLRVPEETLKFYRGAGGSENMRQALKEFAEKHS
jgi:hypothetical protein